MFVAQVIAEWTYHKGIDIIRAGIPSELRDNILQEVGFVAYESLVSGIEKGLEQKELISNVEEAVKNEFKTIIEKLYESRQISEEVAEKARVLSNIDSINDAVDTSEAIEQEDELIEFNKEDSDFEQKDYEGYYDTTGEYVPSSQEEMEMEEYRRNYYENMIKTEPNNPDNYVYLSNMAKNEHPQKAIEYLDKAFDLADDKEVIAYKRGLVKMSIYDGQGAIDDFKLSIEINPNYADSYYELGKLETVRDPLKAIEYFTKAIELQPDNADFYVARGQARYSGGSISGAQEDYKKALELNPDDEQIKTVLEMLENYETGDKDFNQEYQEITKYINENPNDPEGYYNRGYLQYRHEVDDEIVLSDINKAIELNPNYVDAYRVRTYVYEYSGEYDKLIAEYEKIIEIEPTYENYDYYIRYLNTYIENGAQKALKVIEKVFELFPDNAALYQLRGAIRYRLEDYDRAIADYKKAIELNPKNADWKRILKKIEQEQQENS